MVAVDNSKQDTRKIATFNKPRVRLLDENRRLIKVCTVIIQMISSGELCVA